MPTENALRDTIRQTVREAQEITMIQTVKFKLRYWLHRIRGHIKYHAALHALAPYVHVPLSEYRTYEQQKALYKEQQYQYNQCKRKPGCYDHETG